MSVRWSILSPRHCSGLMYSGVPMICPVLVSPPPPVLRSAPPILAIPKSMSRTRPLRVAHDVRGLEVAVDDADVVDRLQPVGGLDRDVERLLVLEVAALVARELLEVGALDVLHRDVAHAAVLAVLVDAADVAVRDLARELDLVAEALRHLARVRELGAQHLDRHGLVEHAVVGLVDHAHAALAERAQDLVARGDDRALRERGERAAAGEAGLGAVVVRGLAGGADHRDGGSTRPPDCAPERPLAASPRHGPRGQASLVAERHHRVDPRRAPRRDVAGEEGRPHREQSHENERERVGGAHAEEQGAQRLSSAPAPPRAPIATPARIVRSPWRRIMPRTSPLRPRGPCARRSRACGG